MLSTSRLRRARGLAAGIALVLAAGVALVLARPVHAAVRGELLDSQRVARLSAAETAKRVKALTLPAARVRFGVDAYRLTYATTGVRGEPITATGLVVLPRTARRRPPTISYEHGTMASRRDAPSRSLDSLAGASIVLFAGAGYPTVAPDYLGLGRGPGRHPYMHAATEASASLDMLRAAHAFAARHHHRLDADTLVTGFSQGAHAAMALGHALQAGADPHLRLRALAPMSGPYDIAHAELPAALDGRLDSLTTNYYLSYVLRAWQPLYRVFDRPSDVWTPSWGARVASLFDGRHDDVAILRALPRRLSQLFTPAFRARLAHPDGGLLTALRANDATCEWAPHVPVRLYAARGDRQVAFENSARCVERLRAHGAAASLFDVGPVDHFPSTLRAAPRVLDWFATMP